MLTAHVGPSGSYPEERGLQGSRCQYTCSIPTVSQTTSRHGLGRTVRGAPSPLESVLGRERLQNIPCGMREWVCEMQKDAPLRHPPP